MQNETKRRERQVTCINVSAENKDKTTKYLFTRYDLIWVEYRKHSDGHRKDKRNKKNRNNKAKNSEHFQGNFRSFFEQNQTISLQKVS